jgi:hypothetical protein
MPAAATLTASLIATLAALQTPGADPSYGELSLSAGFSPDPQEARVRAGGAIPASELDPSCPGFISDAPTLSLEYRAGALDLFISAASGADTTLIVRRPDGGYSCNDDGAGTGFDPAVSLTDPESGRYDVWLGTFGAGAGYPEAVIRISELGVGGENPYVLGLDPNAAAGETLRLESGFSGDPRSTRTSAGGRVDLFAAQPGCAGYADPEPDLRVDYEAGEYPLYFSMQSDSDTTIYVRTPDGGHVCDDDSAGDLNPGVVIREPQSGEYLIWAGAYSSGDRAAAELFISEIGFAGNDASLDLLLPAEFGSAALSTPLNPDPTRVALRAGGPVRVEQTALGESFTVGACTGYVTRAPSYELDWAGDGPLFVSVASEADTTLVINAPDGSWWCDDDSAGDLDPGVIFAEGLNGVYDIYVGAYAISEAEADATLLISATGLGSKPSGTSLQPDAEPVYRTVSLAPGFGPTRGRLAVDATGRIDVGRTALAWMDRGCRGFVTRAPSARLDWAGGGEAVHVYVEGEGDTTLLVRKPDGEWVCNDDDVGLSAGLILNPAAAGAYDIYVGAYGEEGAGSATLVISETPRPLD